MERHKPDFQLMLPPITITRTLSAIGRMTLIQLAATGFLAAALTLAVGLSVGAQEDDGIINTVVVEGNRRVDPETVYSYMNFQPGKAYNNRDIDDSLKELFASGLFTDVSIRRDGDSLIVTVVESPIINQVAFEGNVAISDEDLESETQLKPREVFTRSKAQADVQRVIDIYRRSGRFAAVVEAKIISLEQNRVDLVFEISEGPVTGIRSINFIGNEVFSDSDLRDIIETVETAWWNFFTSSDNYDPDRLTFDRELLRRHYLSEGYADFRVITAVADLTPDGRSFIVTFTVEEGVKYDFGKIAIEVEADTESELSKINLDDLYPLVEFDPGDIYDATKIDDAIDAITFEVSTQGYAFADVRPDVERHPEERVIDVTFIIEQGPRVYVERIDINGNLRTHDEVIRREIRLAEGDAFNRVLLDDSERNIRALGYFGSVEIIESPGSTEDQTVIDVNVTEQSTGELSFGLGYSSTDSIIGDVSLSENNFLGQGQKMSVSFTFGGSRQVLDFHFTEPYFLGRNLVAGFDLFGTETDFQSESSFDSRRTGLGLRLGYPTAENARITWHYNYVEERISSVPAGASAAVRDSAGTERRSLLGYRWAIDHRDDPIAPTKGWSFRFDQEFAGLGGSVDYLSQEAVGRAFFQPADNWIISLRTTGGYITGLAGQDVRISDRFFKGGGSFRGFERAGIGPRDLGTASQDALGAQAFFINTVELSIPLGIPEEFGITTSLFTDFGWAGVADDRNNEAGEDIRDDFAPRGSSGVSFFWGSPLGPVRFDLSRVWLKEDYDKTESFRFSVGARF